jgi:hypothetical protein
MMYKHELDMQNNYSELKKKQERQMKLDEERKLLAFQTRLMEVRLCSCLNPPRKDFNKRKKLKITAEKLPNIVQIFLKSKEENSSKKM